MAFTPDDALHSPRPSDPRPDLDPAVGDQLATLVLTTGQQNFQVNAALGRTGVLNNAIGLTLGVQRANAAMLQQQTSMGVTAAHAATTLATHALPQQLVKR